MSPRREMFLLLSLLFLVVSVFATQASERESQSVEVTFYQLSTSEWSSSTTSFKTLVAAEAATYCTNNAATCGLTSGFLFTDHEVGVNSGPTEDSKSLKISFYIDFPTVHVVDGSSTTTFVINSAATTTILTNIRNSLETAVNADITYIGDEFYSIDPDATMNEVLIPIAFIILLAIIILAVALHIWNNRKEAAEKKVKKAIEREKRKKSSRISPVYTMEDDTKLAGKSYNSNHDAKSAEPVPLRTNNLPPLPHPASEEEIKEQKDERRQEKKEKRRRKRKQHKEGGEEGTGREESESEMSKTESLNKNANVIPVEDEVLD